MKKNVFCDTLKCGTGGNIQDRPPHTREGIHTMKCIKCGQNIAEGAAFCPYCGTKISETTALTEQPVYTAEVKSLTKSGKLVVYRDRAEFVTSNVQKTVFNYSALLAVKKGLDRISFITEDGRTESCPVNRKNIHEAFLYIEKASRPYIDERKNQLSTQGIRYSFVSSLGLAGGILNIFDDRAEFKGKSGQTETLLYENVKSVGASLGMLEFVLTDARTQSFKIEKEIRDEVLAFLAKAIEPFIARRKEALLSKGIYYSFPSSQGPDTGTLNILEDRLEYSYQGGQKDAVLFRNIRTAYLFMGMLELAMTDGTSKSFAVDKDIRDEVLSFVENGIRPYVTQRTVGFETAFGVDEKIEINEARGVFHILRQGGNEITDERPLESLVKCEQVERLLSDSVLGSVLIGGKSLFSSAAGAVGMSGTPDTEEKISYLGVQLTLDTAQTEAICFGSFPMGMGRSNKKYDRYASEAARLMDYLTSHCPACELVIPALPQTALPAIETVAPSPSPINEEVNVATAENENAAIEKDLFGIRNYIEGIAGLIDDCTDSMTIAIQGSWESGGSSIMGMLADSLKASGYDNLVWFHTRLFSQLDSGNQLPMLVGNRLISLLGGTGNTAGDRAAKVAVGIISIISGHISQGSSDGQNIAEALFKDNAMDSLEKLINIFSGLIREKGGKVIFLVDDLDQLAPAKQAELLDAMSGFFGCKGCIFAMAADYNAIISGAKEYFGPDCDENKAINFFDKIFQMSFRAPVSDDNILHYVKDKLEQLGIPADDGTEAGYCVELIGHSIGYEPQGIDRLFNSFRLLKKLSNGTAFANRDRRLMLFALLCMQTKYRDMYDFLLRMRDQVTPAFLSGLCDGQTDASLRLSDEEREKFSAFARIFCDIINLDKQDGISEEECGVFVEVLRLSQITSK